MDFDSSLGFHSRNLQIANPGCRRRISKRGLEVDFSTAFTFLISKALQDSPNTMGALDTGKPEQLGKTGFETLRIKFGQSSLTAENSEQK